MASPSRQQALFELARDLSSTLELDEVARAFTAHAPELTGGEARIWLLRDRPRRLVPLSEPVAERPLDDDAAELAVIRSRRPLRTPALFILPLTASDRAIGVIEVDGASTAQLASGGMQYWRTLGEIVGAAVENARRHEKLMEAASRFRSLVEQIPVVTYIDRAVTGEPIYVSPQIDAVIGVPAAEWLDNPDAWTARIHPDDRDAAVAAYGRTIELGEPFTFEYRVIDVSGRTRWFHDEAVAVATDGNRDDEIHGVVYDITERKQAEQAMRASERALGDAEHRYRTLVEQLPLAIYIDALDEGGTSLYNSPQNEVITGYTHPEWEQDPDLFAKIIHEDDRRRVLDGFEAARIDGAPFVSEYRIVRPDGTMRVGARRVGRRARCRRRGAPPPGVSPRHHPAQARGGAARAPRLPRLADRPSEPRLFRSTWRSRWRGRSRPVTASRCCTSTSTTSSSSTTASATAPATSS